MNMQDVPIFGNTIDKSEVPPIHQKRILAFVNHFIVNTCCFLNDFAQKCENKFIDVERKLQKVEASLVIIEAKLSSIPGLEIKKDDKNLEIVKEEISENVKEISTTDLSSNEQQSSEIAVETNPQPIGVKANADLRYKKYFKMIQFGVPANAVKMKMENDGYDSEILNNPEQILNDGIPCEGAAVT